MNTCSGDFCAVMCFLWPVVTFLKVFLPLLCLIQTWWDMTRTYHWALSFRKTHNIHEVISTDHWEEVLVQRIRAYCSLYSEVRKKKPIPLKYYTSKTICMLKLRCIIEDLAKSISSFIVLRQPKRVYLPPKGVNGEYLYLSLLTVHCLFKATLQFTTHLGDGS